MEEGSSRRLCAGVIAAVVLLVQSPAGAADNMQAPPERPHAASQERPARFTQALKRFAHNLRTIPPDLPQAAQFAITMGVRTLVPWGYHELKKALGAGPINLWEASIISYAMARVANNWLKKPQPGSLGRRLAKEGAIILGGCTASVLAAQLIQARIGGLNDCCALGQRAVDVITFLPWGVGSAGSTVVVSAEEAMRTAQRVRNRELIPLQWKAETPKVFTNDFLRQTSLSTQVLFPHHIELQRKAAARNRNSAHLSNVPRKRLFFFGRATPITRRERERKKR